VLCDIVAFSEKTERDQVQCIQELDRILADLNGPLSHDYVNCTGDGFLAVFRVAVGPEHLINLCEKIVDACRTANPVFAVRLGIHRGDFKAGINVFGTSHIIGRGANEVARIASIGDQSHIIVSETFFDSLDSPALKGRFTAPFQVSVKHNRLMEVRVCLNPSTGGHLNAAIPRRIRLLAQMDDRIFRELEGYIEALSLNDFTGIPVSELKARLSIFIPSQENRKVLVCSSYHVHYSKGRKPAEQNAPRLTRYGTDPPEGTIGKAFVTGEAQCLRGLPDPEVDEDAYVRDVIAKAMQEGLSLQPEAVRAWQRKARSFIAIPFRAAGDSAGETAVLCIDARNPLSSLSDSAVLDIVARLKEDLDNELAWDLLIRRSK